MIYELTEDLEEYRKGERFTLVGVNVDCVVAEDSRGEDVYIGHSTSDAYFTEESE